MEVPVQYKRVLDNFWISWMGSLSKVKQILGFQTCDFYIKIVLWIPATLQK